MVSQAIISNYALIRMHTYAHTDLEVELHHKQSFMATIRYAFTSVKSVSLKSLLTSTVTSELIKAEQPVIWGTDEHLEYLVSWAVASFRNIIYIK